jgi:hypothetical protein
MTHCDGAEVIVRGVGGGVWTWADEKDFVNV